MRNAQRGQALIETVIFLPVVLLVLFGIVYFARLGVLSERVQSAVRYGTLVSYNSAPNYGGADIYNGLGNAGGPAAVCPASVVSDTTAAVTHANAPGALATPVPLWRPDTAASATCSVTMISESKGSSKYAYQIFMVSSNAAVAGIAVPPYLAAELGSTNNATASIGYLHSASPSLILYCLPSIGSAVAAALNTTYGGGGSC